MTTMTWGSISNILVEVFKSSKEKCYLELSNRSTPATLAKVYWTIIKTFVIGRKVPIIPFFLINNKYTEIFLKKKLATYIFHDFFSQQ